jgi:hypothetical protein
MGVYSIFVYGDINDSNTSLTIRANTSEVKTINFSSSFGYSDKYLLNFESDPVRFWVEPHISGNDFITQVSIKYPDIVDVTPQTISTNDFVQNIDLSTNTEESVQTATSLTFIKKATSKTIILDPIHSSNGSYILTDSTSYSTTQAIKYYNSFNPLEATRIIKTDQDILTSTTSPLTASKKFRDGWKIAVKNRDGILDESSMLKERSVKVTHKTLELELLVPKDIKRGWIKQLENDAQKVNELADSKGRIKSTDLSINKSNTYKVYPKETYSPGIGIREWNVKTYNEKSLGRNSEGYIINVQFTNKNSI